MAKTTVRVEGLSELESAMQELGKSMSKAVMRRAAKKALTPMIETARSIVQAQSSDSGGLAESLTVATKLSKRQAKQARRETKSYSETYAGAGALPHAHLVEFGTGERFTDSGKSTGAMPAEPFLRPSWDQHKAEMPQAVGRELWVELEKAASRKAKRDAKKAAQG
jgi:HK97 gp10 family phage protein